MLLRQEIEHGVHVLAVFGPVGAAYADSLVVAVRASLARQPRGVVVDLTDACDLVPEAVAALRALAATTSGWPRASLRFCASSPDVVAELAGMTLHRDRVEALQHIDDRSTAPREQIDLRDGVNSPAQARAAVAAYAERLGLHEIHDDLALVVSEMVTNAVRHAGPPVALEIQTDPDAVLIAVKDGSPNRPRPREAGQEAEGGRGLMLVDLLSVEHGVRLDPPGKTVWAAVKRGPDPVS
ncbi:MAG: ATP-binding protein [Actinomycetota bacterium]|nr:ATP-binding protein [Actinomycetota bacterium]